MIIALQVHDMTKPKVKTYHFVTFPFKYISLRRRYVVYEGDMKEATEKAFKSFGDQWANVYHIDDLERQVAAFNLVEISSEMAEDFLYQEQLERGDEP